MSVVSAYLGIGSNLDDPINQLDQAIAIINAHQQLRLKSVASYYQSPALQLDDQERQPDYINTVVAIDTTLAPHDLLDELQAIEEQQGRVRYKKRWQARTLDIDILVYGEQRINDVRLTVPHIGLPARAFVLYPLFELCPNLLIPGVGVLAELIMHFESKKTSINRERKAGSDGVNLVKLRHVRKRYSSS